MESPEWQLSGVPVEKESQVVHPPHRGDSKLQFWGLLLIIPSHKLISSSVCTQKWSSCFNFYNDVCFTLWIIWLFRPQWGLNWWSSPISRGPKCEKHVHKQSFGGGGGSVAKSCLTLVIPWAEEPGRLQSIGFSRKEYWRGFPFPSPGDLPNPGTEPRSPALQADSLPTELQGKPKSFGSFVKIC